LRKLLVVGAHAVLFHRKPHTDPLRMWAKKLIEQIATVHVAVREIRTLAEYPSADMVFARRHTLRSACEKRGDVCVL
jgi:transposase